MKWSSPEERRAYYLKNDRKRRKEQPEYFLWKAAKRRAKLKELDFDIEVSDIIIPAFCPYLGIAISHEVGHGTRRPSSPSLDRIDSSKGYVKGNIIVCSWRANFLKSDATLQELKLITKQWSQLQSLNPENQLGKIFKLGDVH